MGIIGSILGIILSYFGIEIIENSTLLEINKNIFQNKTVFLIEKTTIIKSFIFANLICIIVINSNTKSTKNHTY